MVRRVRATARGERGTLSWRTADVRRGLARGLLRVREKGLVCSGGVQGHVRVWSRRAGVRAGVLVPRASGSSSTEGVWPALASAQRDEAWWEAREDDAADMMCPRPTLRVRGAAHRAPPPARHPCGACWWVVPLITYRQYKGSKKYACLGSRLAVRTMYFVTGQKS